MSYSKRQLINRSFAKIGLASYAYDLEPDELQGALMELDAMMAKWSSEGVQIGWPLNANPENADLDDDTGLPSGAVSAVIHCLAVRLAPEFGKDASMTVKSIASSEFKTLQGRTTEPPVLRSLLTPAGQGHPISRINRGSYRETYLPDNRDNRIRGLDNEEVDFKDG